ncbi:CopM family metallochaperone [Phyllobacterium myrsinacearum]|uniref:Uncharacterized protein (DUF305 family) n=1 Tax=Phyllobacterium myrsinacearum TaxID=28101 RepID=A0A839EG44_9HYPH|nr:DUF305 domain-containing protein [Phyllobacterium myrsinacearum]MBA8876436.1 uncharacterized protein (DUF305 family) [Phyllobacterium myrsinacearum]
MKITYFSAVVIAGLLALASPAMAQEHKMMNHDAMAMKPAGDQGASSKAFAEANAKMHKDMTIKFSGDADKDFVRGMIAHHQGAIDMAKVELKYGKDEDIRKLATDIIAAQEGEIKQMKAWLAKHGG